ncbi:MAG: hypothetical protein HY860_00795 [Chlamydiales bacterium]|nr:hypothetical protein [Chlamydiales bacterium]
MNNNVSLSTQRIGKIDLPESRESFVYSLGESLYEWRNDIEDAIIITTPGPNRTYNRCIKELHQKPTYVVLAKKTVSFFAFPSLGILGIIEGLVRSLLFTIGSLIPWTWETTFYEQECKKLSKECFTGAASAFYYTIPQLFIDDLDDC